MNWFENDTRFILAHQQPAVLIDLAMAKGLESHRLFRHTGIFYEDILQADLRISPSQFFQLIENSSRLLPASDISFLFGSRLYPGNLGAFTEALLSSENLHQALETLSQYHVLATPVLKPVISIEYLYRPWLNASNTAHTVARLACSDLLSESGYTGGFIWVLYDYLQQRLRNLPSLEQTAADFGMSPASLKRKLKKHHSSYGAEPRGGNTQ